MKRIYAAGAIVAPLALLLALLLTLAPAAQAVSEPAPGTVTGAATYRYLAQTVITNGVTIYTAVPNPQGTNDASRVEAWNSADLFVTASVGQSATLTVTPQLSADCANYANAGYDAVLSGTITAQTYQIVSTAAGTKYTRLPLAGRCMRFAVASTGTVTVSVWATLRNN